MMRFACLNDVKDALCRIVKAAVNMGAAGAHDIDVVEAMDDAFVPFHNTFGDILDLQEKVSELKRLLQEARDNLPHVVYGMISLDTLETDRAERRRAVRNAFTELLYGIRTDRKITAIKAVRQATDWGLKDAKDYTENLIDALKPRA